MSVFPIIHGAPNAFARTRGDRATHPVCESTLFSSGSGCAREILGRGQEAANSVATTDGIVPGE
jgi:hypothetical protein